MLTLRCQRTENFRQGQRQSSSVGTGKERENRIDYGENDEYKKQERKHILQRRSLQNSIYVVIIFSGRARKPCRKRYGAVQIASPTRKM